MARKAPSAVYSSQPLITEAPPDAAEPPLVGEFRRLVFYFRLTRPRAFIRAMEALMAHAMENKARLLLNEREVEFRSRNRSYSAAFEVLLDEKSVSGYACWPIGFVLDFDVARMLEILSPIRCFENISLTVFKTKGSNQLCFMIGCSYRVHHLKLYRVLKGENDLLIHELFPFRFTTTADNFRRALLQSLSAKEVIITATNRCTTWKGLNSDGNVSEMLADDKCVVEGVPNEGERTLKLKLYARDSLLTATEISELVTVALVVISKVRWVVLFFVFGGCGGLGFMGGGGKSAYMHFMRLQ